MPGARIKCVRILLVDHESAATDEIAALLRALGMEVVRGAVGDDAPPCDLVLAPADRIRPTGNGDLDLRRQVPRFERELFQEALRRAAGKKSAAARMLGIDPSNWAYHAKRLKLQ